MTRNTFRPGLESLERRDCTTVTLANGTLTIIGTSGPDRLLVTQNDTARTITVEDLARASTHVFDGLGVQKIEVKLKGSDDEFTFDLADGSDFTRAKKIDAKLGLGADVARFSLSDNGSGGLATIAANLRIKVTDTAEANPGPFNVTRKLGIELGNVSNANVKLESNFGNVLGLGGLSDPIVRLLGDVAGASTVSMLFTDGIGGSGHGFFFDMTNDVDVAKEARVDVQVIGGQLLDRVNLPYFGKLDGTLRFHLDGGDSGDVMSAGVRLEAGSQGSLDGKVRGASGDDTLLFQLEGNLAGSANALLNGSSGFDRSEASPGVQTLNVEGPVL